MNLTVFFENPFWVGIFEEVTDDKLCVCKVTFGAEPKDCEIFEFILRNYYKLKFSQAVEIEVKQVADNPKRRQRNARKQLENAGIGTKSQQALKKQHELMKTERKQKSRLQREEEKQRLFELKQQKKKDKHRGH
ncbi:MAG: YjdF family protein [Clostridiales bacterium]|nr:YjdF family protein [Clostridiales bacterium]